MLKVSAIIVAAGSGSRFSTDPSQLPKQFLSLNGQPILSKILNTFENQPLINEVILVVPKNWLSCLPFDISQFKKLKICAGGDSRGESVLSGFKLVSKKADLVLIHDGARPILDSQDLLNLIDTASQKGAAIIAHPISDTIKKVDSEGMIIETIDRKQLWGAKTPQAFKRDILEKAFALNDLTFTDEASMVECCGYKVYVVLGNPSNIKITTPNDLKMCESLSQDCAMNIRVGQGFDVHAFEAKKPLFLAGVLVPFDYGLKGHSDADVIIHALIDALFGAAGLGDIGEHFPDNQLQWKGASGALLLNYCMEKVKKEGWEIVNADLTFIGEKPKISAYKMQMRAELAKILNIKPFLINIKATTTEKLGFLGRCEGLAAQAVVLIKK